MAATLLSSSRAIEVFVYVVHAFIRLRELTTQQDKRLPGLEDKTEALAVNRDIFSRSTRNQLKQVFDALREMMPPPAPPSLPEQPIGFIWYEDKGSDSASKGRKGKASSAAPKKK